MLFGALGLAAVPIRAVVSTVDLRKIEESFVIHLGRAASFALYDAPYDEPMLAPASETR
jgi:hypothetical protein